MWGTCCARNIWRAHVSGKRTVADMYDALVAKGALRDDPRQRAVAHACTPLIRHIESLENDANAPQCSGTASLLQPQPQQQQQPLPLCDSRGRTVLKSFFRLCDDIARHAFADRATRDVSLSFPENMGVSPKSGIYLWGSVGIGKTVMMDLFELCDTPRLVKRRAHLHSFMSEVILRLRRAESAAAAASMHSSLHSSPMDSVVSDVLRESPVLCLDEFQTFDVAHAALLAAFFARALPRGLILFTTSNRPPHELTRISTGFEQFLAVLWRHCEVIHCGDIRDYRENASRSYHHGFFLSPCTKENARRLLERVEGGFGARGCTWAKGETIWLYGRELVVPYSCAGAAVFDFIDICTNIGPPDFQCIAKSFHTVVITNVPHIGVVSKNVAQQFIILVDELYQYNVKLLFTSEVPWEQLLETAPAGSGVDGTADYSEGEDERSGYTACYDFRNEEEVLSFGRIASRLKEMGCRHYILRDHSHFLVSDYNFAALLD